MMMTNFSSGPSGVGISGLRCDYGAVATLHSIDLDIRSGEFVSLLGPSGCGKTTLLRCIAGLNQPTAGEILLGGRPISSLPIHKRNVGMVFQSYALFPHMTVAQNVAFGLKMAKVVKSEADERVAEALELVAMQSFAERYPSQLSGGQQQRVALARAIVTRPSVLLLDEPFGALDAKLRTGLQAELRSLQQRLHVTTIFVTHDQEEAMVMSDRIAVMNSGKIHQFADPMSVYDRPSTTFVAEFVGQVNVLSQDVPGIDIGASERAIIRPERVFVGSSPTESLVTTIAGTVVDAVFCGDTIRVTLNTPAGQFVSTQKHNGNAPLSVAGQSVEVWWRKDDIVRFDAAGQATTV